MTVDEAVDSLVEVRDWETRPPGWEKQPEVVAEHRQLLLRLAMLASRAGQVSGRELRKLAERDPDFRRGQYAAIGKIAALLATMSRACYSLNTVMADELDFDDSSSKYDFAELEKLLYELGD